MQYSEYEIVSLWVSINLSGHQEETLKESLSLIILNQISTKTTARYSLFGLSNFAFQFLGIFYLALAVLLVWTNMGRNKEDNLKKPGESIDCIQIMDGRGFKCHLVRNQGIGICLEDEV